MRCVAAPSMDLGLGNRRRAFQEIEIAALIGLADVAREDGAVAARELRLGLAPRALAPGELRGVDLEIELALLDIELDQVAVLHQGKRAADERFRRDGQNAGTRARAAQARIANAHH